MAVNRRPVVVPTVRRAALATSVIVSAVFAVGSQPPLFVMPPIHFAKIPGGDPVTVGRIVPVRSASKGWSLVRSARSVIAKPCIGNEALTATATLS
jgi:hypothetical protein